MSSAVLLYSPAIVRKLAGIFRAGYKEKQTEDSHFQTELSFKSISNFLFTFLIVPHGLSLLPQQSLGFPKEDKAEEEVWDVAGKLRALLVLPASRIFVLSAVRGCWKKAHVVQRLPEDRETEEKEK